MSAPHPGLYRAIFSPLHNAQGESRDYRGDGLMRGVHGVLDTSIANVALPYIAGGVAASVDDASRVLT